jgi:thiol-disulfide isomerase/thioredoxin
MAAILLHQRAVNWKPLILCALFVGSLSVAHAAEPMSCREIAMLLRNGENPQFIIQETTRRKLLHPLSQDEENTLRSLNAAPALMKLLHDPAVIASPEAATAYAAQLEQRKLLLAQQDQRLAEQAAANARLLQQQQAQSAPNTAQAANPSAAANSEFAGKPIHLKFNAADGSPVDLAKLRGKVVLIDFWATWCGPCMSEVPNVVAAYKKYHDRGFEIVGISLDKDKATMFKVMAQKGMTWPQYFDGKVWNNEISTGFHIHSIPAMWIINKKGIVATTEARGNLDGEIARLLAE